ncbi:MAG: imidazole glycerol phosphate synthase subunit HisH [Myxococcales bacterium]|nr:imidazole glycerol phosphate synthase subunit HisH [Myxococcales bacterium]
MNRAVTVVDLGLGNLHSVHQALVRAGASPVVTRDPAQVREATRLVVPGQGAFREGSAALAGPLGDALRAYLAAERPYLGICLGMQLLFEGSEEAPGAPGLGVFAGSVRRFPRDLRDAAGRRLKVPHMGWRPLVCTRPSALVEDGAWMYFVHSYHCVPTDPSLTVAHAEHGGAFCAAVERDHVFACQFHPEKSQRRGARLLEAFVRWS